MLVLSFSLLLIAVSPAYCQTKPPTPPTLDSGRLLGALLSGFWQSIMMCWYVWVAIALIIGLKLYFARRRRQALAAAGIADIDTMDGRTFEACLEVLFARKGYQVERTRYVGDYGGDLILSKDGVKTIVQAKRWKKTVGVKAIQEAVAAKAMYGCTEAMVVINSAFSQQAKELARANRVSLWDRDKLIHMLLSVAEEGQSLASGGSVSSPTVYVPAPLSEAPGKTPNGANRSRNCNLCHKPVSAEVAQYCLSRPQRFGGQVYCYDHQRKMRPQNS
jgi:restriction system protein